MFKKVLIANRGAIACRIIRTLKEMGIQSLAVYSDADKASLHVTQADEAVRIGPSPASESYLDFKNILRIAREHGAEAIHPGYGFLAENAEFSVEVDPNEIDAARGYISIDSPLARALLGRRAGDTVEVDLPDGRERFQLVAVDYS